MTIQHSTENSSNSFFAAVAQAVSGRTKKDPADAGKEDFPLFL
jgi:hypothetical protein